MSFAVRCSELGGYGNGLVPRDHTATGSNDQSRRPAFCKFKQMRWASQQSDCPLIDLPEQCVVYWSGANYGDIREEIRATSTTTYGELYDCTGPLAVYVVLAIITVAMHQLSYIYAPPRLHPGFYLAFLVLAGCVVRPRSSVGFTIRHATTVRSRV